uniref:Uncharacterized protein n=1 Tax=Brassica oleracea var. oleracea TaxID=109376 RepID=A0A0D3BYE3_BRAOL
MDPSKFPFDMDPSELLFDIEAYKMQSEIEERHINDINVLDLSPVFDDVEQGNTRKVNFFETQ